eukprot:949265-Rhodomonas_salina.1
MSVQNELVPDSPCPYKTDPACTPHAKPRAKPTAIQHASGTKCTELGGKAFDPDLGAVDVVEHLRPRH